MNEQQKLYAELDATTGGLPAFLSVVRDETWTLEPYEPFNLTTLSPDTVLFGFRKLMNGDMAPDPQIRVRIDLAARTAAVEMVETIFSYRTGSDIAPGNYRYAVDLLAEMRRRRKASPDMQVRVWEAQEGVTA